MTATEWIIVLARVLALVGLCAGAYTGYRRMRAEGTWSTAVVLWTFALIVVYVGVGLTVITASALSLPEGYAWLLLAIAVIYFGGGIVAVTKIAGRIQQRLAKPPDG